MVLVARPLLGGPFGGPLGGPSRSACCSRLVLHIPEEERMELLALDALA